MTPGAASAIMLEPDDDAVALLRDLSADSVVVVIRPGRDASGLALARAAIAALAPGCAPRRLNAVQPSDATDPEAIGRAVAYLAYAPAVTGQIIALR